MDKFLTICYHQLLGVVYNATEWFTLTVLAAASVFLSIGLYRASVYLVKTLASTNRLISDLAKVIQKRDFYLSGINIKEKVTVNVIPETEKQAAFTMGWLNPSVYMTSALVENSDPDSIDIILRHELSHCRRYDPLRLMLLNTASELLWFIPVIKPRVENSKLASELAADKSAIDAGHDRVHVARVLVQVAESPISPFRETAPAVSSIMDNLEFRVRSLLSENPLKLTRIRPGIIIASILIVSTIFISSGAVITAAADPGGQVTMLEQTAGACTDNNHSVDVLTSLGLECPHCGQSATLSESTPPTCHGHS